jgi:hypothetical protein
MLQPDIYSFLNEGQIFGFNNNSKESDIVNKLGKPDEIEDYDNKGKYLHYDNLRFLITDKELSGIALFVMSSNVSYEIKVEDDVFVLNKNTPLTELLHLLNKIGLKWHIPYEQSKLDYLLVEIQSGVKIYYYLENNYLERITRSAM